MANKYDLKTWAKIDLTAAVSTTGAAIGDTVVATGKNRFLTYIRVQRVGVSAAAGNAVASMLIGIGSVSSATPDPSHVLATTYLKMPIQFLTASSGGAGAADVALVQEIRGSIEHPILSVGGGGYMGIAASLTAGETVDVFAQYFDE